MTIKDQAREIVAAHYDAKGWTTRAAAFRDGSINCADDVDLAVMAISIERERCVSKARLAMVDNADADELTCTICAAAIRVNP